MTLTEKQPSGKENTKSDATDNTKLIRANLKLIRADQSRLKAGQCISDAHQSTSEADQKLFESGSKSDQRQIGKDQCKRKLSEKMKVS